MEDLKVIELTNENIHQYVDECVAVQKFLVKPDAKINPELFVETAADLSAYFIGVLDEGKLIGMGVVGLLVHPVAKSGYINNIVVSPEAQGKGLFKIIMGDLEEKARSWGCKHIELTCSREAVQGMYERRGYKQKETNFYRFELK